MKKLILIILTVFFVFFEFISCEPTSNSDGGMPAYLNPELSTEKRVNDLLSRMTLHEKVGQMNQYVAIDQVKEWRVQNSLNTGDNQSDIYADPDTIENRVERGEIGSFLFVSGPEEANKLQKLAESSRLKIPLLNGIDAIHGHAMFPGGATTFPTSIGLSCSWDTLLARQIADVTAKEMSATGYNWAFFPTVDILRDPRWGRTGETFGEDTYLVSLMSNAFVKGFQESDPPILACSKGFIAGSEPLNGLNFAPMEVSQQTFREIFLLPYIANIKNGLGSIMAAHHELNGTPIHASRELLTKLLREEIGFEGIIISDWTDIFRLHTLHKVAKDTAQAVKLAVNAGIDIHMHGPGFFKTLVKLVEKGEVSEQRIDDAVKKILTAKFKLGLFENRYVDETVWKQKLQTKEHRQLALRAAEESIVLLKNESDILPLGDKYKSIFITGPNANGHNILGDWSLDQQPENVVTILEGINNVANDKQIDYYDCGSILEIGDEQISTAVKKARKSDVTVVVIGGNALRVQHSNRTYGENTARSSINLAGKQLDLVKALYNTHKPIIVIFVTGRPTSEPWISNNIPALLYAWEPGIEGGKAIANVLFGKVNPSGKLTTSFPRNAGHIPAYYNHKPSMYFRNYVLEETPPLYPFGYGLSYTTFKYDDFSLSNERITQDESIDVKVNVTNAGNIEGTEIVQLYLNDNYASTPRPVKELKRFARVHLSPGESKSINFTLDINDLKFYSTSNQWIAESGSFTVMVGGNSQNVLKKDFVLAD